MRNLAADIIRGRRLKTKEECRALITKDLKELCEGANEIRKHFCGDKIDLCTIVNGRGGRCSEDCKFCAQSRHHKTQCDEFAFLSKEEFLSDCKRVSDNGVDRYSIVTSGRTLDGQDFEKAIEVYKDLRNTYPDMKLCASHGLMKEENLKRLVEVGVTRYHSNIETSESFFPKICTTHTFADKKEEIRRAKAAGLKVCSGGIFGMGESWEDRIEMALFLSDIGVDSIPLNFLIPIQGTPFEGIKKLENNDILRMVAMFRYINPEADIRIAAGRKYFKNGGDVLFKSGANATITGDLLTSTGNNTKQDRSMFLEMNFKLKDIK